MIAFVEGSMERQFLNSNMKYVRVIPVKNGIAWTVERMCAQICSAYEALDLKASTIVWIDREGRNETSEEISERIKESLISSGASPDDIHIMINDKMCENLILADEYIIKQAFNDNDYSYSHEGKSGKSAIKQMYQNMGISYKETKHGVDLLKKIRISRCAENSDSAKRFLNTFKTECWWV